MIRGICDRPDRAAARLYLALRSDCPCCTFWRGAAAGLIAGLWLAAGVALVARFT